VSTSYASRSTSNVDAPPSLTKENGMDGNDHTASRRLGALEREAPHLIAGEPPSTMRQRVLLEIIELASLDATADDRTAADLHRIRVLARHLHELEPQGVDAFRLTGDPIADNRVRARAAMLTLATFPLGEHADLTDPEHVDEVVGDLVCDLLHFVEQAGGDVDAVLERGERHYRDEVIEAT
jgi:hypothetical protein